MISAAELASLETYIEEGERAQDDDDELIRRFNPKVFLPYLAELSANHRPLFNKVDSLVKKRIAAKNRRKQKKSSKTIAAQNAGDAALARALSASKPSKTIAAQNAGNAALARALSASKPSRTVAQSASKPPRTVAGQAIAKKQTVARPAAGSSKTVAVTGDSPQEKLDNLIDRLEVAATAAESRDKQLALNILSGTDDNSARTVTFPQLIQSRDRGTEMVRASDAETMTSQYTPIFYGVKILIAQDRNQFESNGEQVHDFKEIKKDTLYQPRAGYANLPDHLIFFTGNHYDVLQRTNGSTYEIIKMAGDGLCFWFAAAYVIDRMTGGVYFGNFAANGRAHTDVRKRIRSHYIRWVSTFELGENADMLEKKIRNNWIDLIQMNDGLDGTALNERETFFQILKRNINTGAQVFNSFGSSSFL
jgi:hypothetical protein